MVRALIVLAALEEQPLYSAALRLGGDLVDHPRAEPCRAQRGIDRQIGERAEAHPRGLCPFDDRRGDDHAFGIMRDEQALVVVPVLQVGDEQRFEVGGPDLAVGAQPALDLAVADIARIAADGAREEAGDGFGYSRLGSGRVRNPSEISLP